jgi:hypothetical protein
VKNRFRSIVALAALLVLGGLICLFSPGCARVAEQKAEQRVNALLPGYIGPAQRYQTRIRSESTGALMRGRVRSVHVDGTSVQLEPMLTFDTLTLDFSEVEVDPKAGVLRSVGSAAFGCRIAEASLNRYVRAQRPDIPDLSIALRGDRIVVTARPEVLGIGAPVSVEGTLAPRSGGSYLNFEPDRAKVTIVPVPGLVLDYLSRRLNPVIDLSRLRVPIRVERAEVRGGALHLSGSVLPDDLLKAAGATSQP